MIFIETILFFIVNGINAIGQTKISMVQYQEFPLIGIK